MRKSIEAARVRREENIYSDATGSQATQLQTHTQSPHTHARHARPHINSHQAILHLHLLQRLHQLALEVGREALHALHGGWMVVGAGCEVSSAGAEIGVSLCEARPIATLIISPLMLIFDFGLILQLEIALGAL